MSAPDGAAEARLFRYRIDKSEKRLEKIDEWRTVVDIERTSTREIVKATKDDVAELHKAFDSLRKTLVTFAFTIAGSAVIFALGILAATGRLHT